MIECVNGNGLGSCAICSLIKGWHRTWSSSLFYVRNAKGLFLRQQHGHVIFSYDEDLPKVAFCYTHANLVDNEWKIKPAYNLSKDDIPF